MLTPEELAELERTRTLLGGAQEPQAAQVAPERPAWHSNLLGDAADTVAAIPRGAVAGVMDAYGLIDSITGDALPDWDNNPLGKSDSVVAGLVEGVANFAVGFIPAAGLLGGAGKLGKLSRAAGLVQRGPVGATGKLAHELPFFQRVRGLTFAGDVVAGAAADALVFNAHDGRLADLVKLHPGLQNAVEDYIGWAQTHEDDSEAWGRVKNVLEGAGVGGMIGALHIALRKYVFGRKRLTLGDVPETPEPGSVLAAAAEARTAVEPAAVAAVPAKPAVDLVDDGDILVREIERGLSSGDNRRLMINPHASKTLDELRSGANTDGGSTFNLDGTDAGLRGTDTYTVTIASEVVPQSQLTPQRVAEYVNDFGSLHDNPSMKAGVFKMPDEFVPILDKTLARTDPITGEPQWSVDFNVVVPHGSEARVRAHIQDNGQISFWDNKTWSQVVVNPNASGVSKIKTADEAEAAVKRLLSKESPDDIKPAEQKSASQPDAPPGRAEGRAEEPASGAYTGSLRDLGMDESTIREWSDFIETGTGLRGKLDLPEGLNPRDMFRMDRIGLGMRKTDLNLSRNSLRDGVELQKRAIESLYRDAMEADIRTLEEHTMEEMSEASAKNLAAMVGRSDGPESLAKNMLVRMRGDERTLADLTARLNANEMWLNKFADEVFSAATLLSNRPLSAGPEQKAALIAKYQMLAEAVALVKGSKSERGRALRSLGVGGKFGELLGDIGKFGTPLKQNDDLVLGTIDAAGGDKAVDKMIKRLAEAGKSDGSRVGKALAVGRAARLAEASVGRKTLNVITEYWLNALLSGPQTSAVNTISAAMFSIYRPFESVVGNAAARALSTDPRMSAAYSRIVRDSAREVVALFTGVGDALRLSLDTFKTANSTLTPDAHAVDSLQPRDRAAIHSETDSNVGAAINWIGKVVRVPTHVMAGTDEFFRQLTYRAYAQAHLTGEALDAGKRGVDVANHVTRGMDRLSYKGQAYSIDMLRARGRDEALRKGVRGRAELLKAADEYAKANFRPDTIGAVAQTGLRYAREVTLSTPLERGTLAAGVQRLAQEHPILRFIAPFIRTPTNVILSASQRLPVVGGVQLISNRIFGAKFPKMAFNLEASKQRLVMDLLSKDPRRIADAHGRVVVGATAVAIGMTAASSGLITGRGPSDPQQRKTLTDAGWLPYSIKTANGYVSYARLDPFATVIGIMADTYDVHRFSHDADRTATEEFSTGLLVALANNITNKSYLVGLANFVEMAQAPDRKAEGWVRKMAASFVPNIVKSGTTAAGDEDMRDARTIADALMAKTPFLAQDVRPFRNVLGEPIKKTTAAGADAVSGWLDAIVPFSYRQVTNDALRLELADIVKNGGAAFGPPSPNRYGLDMRDVKKADGVDAYDRYQELSGLVKVRGRTLRSELESKVRSARFQALPRVVEDDLGSPRAKEIMSTVQQHRSAAWDVLVKEFPELAARERMYLNQKRDMTSGGSSLSGFAAALTRGPQ